MQSINRNDLSTPISNLTDRSLLNYGAYINGRWLEAEDIGDTYVVTDPATGNMIARVAACGAQEAEEAIHAAGEAQMPWAKKPVKVRSRLLRDLFELVSAHSEDLARIVTYECGKPLSEARTEIAYGAAYLEWFAEEAKRINGNLIPAPGPDRRIFVTREAVGVVACITPWNFPIAMLLRKIAPALAAGCAVVCKPSEETPLSALAIAELVHRAGFPAGVVNVVSGRPSEIGAAFTSSPVVRKLTFTGSTRVGKLLMAACAPTLKRTSMELGGNAPFIVFDDADLDRAVSGLIAAKFRNGGQTCIAANRVLVQSGIQTAFISRLKAAVSRLQTGNGFEDGVAVGPMINAAAVNRIAAVVQEAENLGAERLTDIAHDPCPGFVAPTLLSGVTPDMRVWQEEIFGPIVAISVFQEEAEAVAAANASSSGLAAYLFTSDSARIWRLGSALQFGMIGINEAAISNEMAPFGGVKESGHGREGSVYGLDDYLDYKYICLGGIEA